MEAGGQRRGTQCWWVAISFSLMLSCVERVSAQIKYSVPEEVKVGSVVGNVAKDLGLDISSLEERRFRIVSGAEDAQFEVNPNNGALYVHGNIDREELCERIHPCIKNLKLVAENPMEIHHVGVEIVDVNDNSPSFQEYEKILEMSESTITGRRFQLPTAHDPDVVTNTVRMYKLNHNDHFSLQIRERGEDKVPFLVLQKSLDREKESEHKLILTAVDGGNPPRSGTLNVTVIVLDSNDNHPTFSQEVYYATIRENTDAGVFVIKLNATDLDEGLNGQIEYFFGGELKGNLYEIFNMDKDTGELRINGEIDFEKTDIFKLDVHATDKGQPPMSADCTVIINVLDVNDNKPEIEVTSLSKIVSEDSKPGTVVALISITDQDAGLNGKYLEVTQILSCFLTGGVLLKSSLEERRFRIVSGAEDAQFEVNPNNGVLYVHGNIDREELCERIHPCIKNLKLVAENPMEIHYVGVEIMDVNDNSPSFTDEEKIVEIPESTLQGKRFQLPAARDPDVVTNTVRMYKLNHNDHFSLQIREMGEDKIPFLVLQKSLDREKESEHKLILTAVDGGNPPRTGTLNVTVIVLDSNDNHPTFNQELYSVTIPENVDRDTSVTRVNATDLDEGVNGKIEYFFGGELNTKLYDTFSLDKDTGEIRVKGEIDFENMDVYKLDVHATDKGQPPMSTNCRVIINVLDVNDNKPEIEVTSVSKIVSEDSKPGTVVALISITDQDAGLNGDVLLKR
ncbi:protocadherin gamma-A4-like [Neolamprologus brichardi]|uniref:protocadherin gamma-A4-like n=1 Tax=Neolamprologus brichardi TaxID=32507 RepID=UPI0016439E56|nr:protocadherin gamma-A4-like [Neolamprologus brichardi]